MATVWFILLSAMLAAYVVLDGYDLGAGTLHLALARDDAERQLILRAIGPYWDGNEVWLVAGGGVLFLAFPPVYASAFSGFYLPLMLVLWLLVGRGVALELRGQIAMPLWRSFWDAVFCCSSAALALVLGAALGNVLRGVPLDEHGDFFVPFWTDFRPSARPGALDWYTILIGLLAVAALASHGAQYLAFKTSGDFQARARRLARRWSFVALALTGAALPATALVRPDNLAGFRGGPWGPLSFAVALAGWGVSLRARGRGRDGVAFLGSCAYLGGLFASAAVGLFPYLLPSSGPRELGLTAPGSAAAASSLKLALAWWIVGVALAVGYFVLVHRTFRGKVEPGGGGYH